MSVQTAYQGFMAAALFVLVVLSILCLARCIKGPRISDRVLAVNMIGTLTNVMVVVFVVLLGEGYLVDIALVYAMISFLAVILLSKVYLGIYRERKHEEELLAQQAEAEGGEGK